VIVAAKGKRQFSLAGVMPNTKVRNAILRIAKAYQTDPEPWLVAYSGGKDSSALLKLIYHALIRLRGHHKRVTVLYCNSGVEVPCVSTIATQALRDFQIECTQRGLPVDTAVVKPALRERFFAKVIGRGYPPPTDKFRWCTDRLLIKPVSSVLKQRSHNNATVVLGLRDKESATRSLTLKQNEADGFFWRRQRGRTSTRLFLPILTFDVDDVWISNLGLKDPKSLRSEEVAELYASASRYPTRRGPFGAPSGQARFGCWTCTVAKHGVTLRNLIRSGQEELAPLLEFRLWLEAERNNPENRWKVRRNGQVGLGPMTLEWRREALKRLVAAEQESGFVLIERPEIAEIIRFWREE
jgi:DNA sulfur modification protein DndC